MTEDKPYLLIKRLAEGEFCSGEMLANLLGVSRTTVASYIKQLGLLGLDIFKVKGKGYRLSEPLSLLDQNLIKQSLPDNNPLVFNKLDSTNAWLMRHLHDLQHGQLVLAEYQSLGRGRRGRDWQTPYAGQLCMSLLWHLEDGIEAAMGLSLAVGLAIVEALQECGYQQLGLKWPNDIYQNGKKLGGVLIEIQGHANSKLSLVVGLGINVRVAKLHADKIDQSFSQLESEKSPAADRSALSVAVARSLNTMFEVFREQGFAGLQQRWNQYDVFFNKPVCLRFSEHKLVSGVAKGVDASGQLLLENDGLVRTYMAGEVSLRGQ